MMKNGLFLLLSVPEFKDYVSRVELDTRLLALFAKMGFAASSSASEQTSADDLASLVSALAATRPPADPADAQGLQGLQGALLADSVLSRCRAEDTQLVKVGPPTWMTCSNHGDQCKCVTPSVLQPVPTIHLVAGPLL